MAERPLGLLPPHYFFDVFQHFALVRDRAFKRHCDGFLLVLSAVSAVKETTVAHTFALRGKGLRYVKLGLFTRREFIDFDVVNIGVIRVNHV